MIAEFAPRTPLGHREVREDKFGELAFRQLHGDRRYFRIFDCGAHHVRASCEAYRFARESPDFSTYYNRLGPFAKLAISSIDTAERKLAKARAQRAIDEHDARFDALNDARMAMHAAEAQLAHARERVKRCRVAKTIAEELSPHDTAQRQRAMRELLSAQQAEAEAALACTEAKARVKAGELDG